MVETDPRRPTLVALPMGDPQSSVRDPKLAQLIGAGWEVQAHLPCRRPGADQDEWLLLLAPPSQRTIAGTLRLHPEDVQALAAPELQQVTGCVRVDPSSLEGLAVRLQERLAPPELQSVRLCEHDRELLAALKPSELPAQAQLAAGDRTLLRLLCGLLMVVAMLQLAQLLYIALV